MVVVMATTLPLAVDDGDMAGALLLDGLVDAGHQAAQLRRRARAGPAHGRFGIDERAARRQVAGIQQPDGHAHEIGVADVVVAVGEGELLGLGDQVQRPGVEGVGRPLPRSKASTSFSACATANPPEDGGPMPQMRFRR